MLLLAALGAAAWALAAAWGDWRLHQAGARLFDGRAPLVGQVLGHNQALPVQAARCANCHGAQAGWVPAAGASASTPSQRLAPVLSAALLRRSQARRGGPPSHYDAASLCRLLRTGVDPAWVMLPRGMPRYQISTSDCQALWAHLAE